MQLGHYRYIEIPNYEIKTKDNQYQFDKLQRWQINYIIIVIFVPAIVKKKKITCLNISNYTRPTNPSYPLVFYLSLRIQ